MGRRRVLLGSHLARKEQNWVIEVHEVTYILRTVSGLPVANEAPCVQRDNASIRCSIKIRRLLIAARSSGASRERVQSDGIDSAGRRCHCLDIWTEEVWMCGWGVRALCMLFTPHCLKRKRDRATNMCPISHF